MVTVMNSLSEITGRVSVGCIAKKSVLLHTPRNRRNFITLATTDSTNTTPDSSNPPNDENAPVSINSKKPSLTARERLRAARVLSKFAEPKPKPPKSEFGSKVLDAMKEMDKGKKKKGSRLPEAPTNMLDDNKRGLPQGKWSINLGLGNDVILIVVSFVVISTIMLSTTYLVWKVGAIHFNEY